MERIKISDNLYLDEYIPKSLYLEYKGRYHILLGLIDSNLIKADQKLRNIFGEVIINNWATGGDRQWSGFRTPDSPNWSRMSQHSFGRASDKLFIKFYPEEVREYIRKYWRDIGITCIEDEVSWVHSDIRTLADTSRLLIVPKPK
jgi:hypothetical protein